MNLDVKAKTLQVDTDPTIAAPLRMLREFLQLNGAKFGLRPLAVRRLYSHGRQAAVFLVHHTDFRAAGTQR